MKKFFVLFLLIASPCFAQSQQSLNPYQAVKEMDFSKGISLPQLEKAISSGSLNAAKLYLSNHDLQNQAESGGNMSLRRKAQAIADLSDVAEMDWNYANFNNLNQILALKMQNGSLLSECGIGPEPENICFGYRLSSPARQKRIISLLNLPCANGKSSSALAHTAGQ